MSKGNEINRLFLLLRKLCSFIIFKKSSFKIFKKILFYIKNNISYKNICFYGIFIESVMNTFE